MGLARNDLANVQFGAYGEQVAFGLTLHPVLKLFGWTPLPCPTTSWLQTVCPTTIWAQQAGVTSTWVQQAGVTSTWTQLPGVTTTWTINPDSDPDC